MVQLGYTKGEYTMPMSKEIRAFFVTRIKDEINKKKDAIKTKVNEEALQIEARRLLSDRLGLGTIQARVQKLSQQKEKLDKEQEQVDKELRIALENFEEKPRGYGNFYGSPWNNFTNTAEKVYYEDVFAKEYPEEKVELERLDKLALDAEGTVLLATSQPALVEALNTLLKKYGGDISEILDMIK